MGCLTSVNNFYVVFDTAFVLSASDKVSKLEEKLFVETKQKEALEEELKKSKDSVSLLV